VPNKEITFIFPIAMICLAADIQVVIKPLPRYFKPASIGPLYLKMFMPMFGLATVVKGQELGYGGMKCPYTIFSRPKSLMFEMWASWVLFYPLEGIVISWLWWIMCLNGWKPLLATNDSRVVARLFNKIIFTHFGVLQVLMVPSLSRRNLEQF